MELCAVGWQPPHHHLTTPTTYTPDLGLDSSTLAACLHECWCSKIHVGLGGTHTSCSHVWPVSAPVEGGADAVGPGRRLISCFSVFVSAHVCLCPSAPVGTGSCL
jgi:hypothetical protein